MKNVVNKYISKPENGITICQKQSVGKDFIIDEVRKKCSVDVAELLKEMDDTWRTHIPVVEISSEYKGVAKCDPRDTYDEKIGRDIALLTASKKYHKAAAVRYGKLANYFVKVMSEMLKLQDSHLLEERKIEEELKKYIN